MSENEKAPDSNDGSETVAGDNGEADPSAPDTAASEAQVPRKSSGSSSALAWLALLLAMVAVGGSGWLWWQQAREEASADAAAALQELSADIEAQSATLSQQSGRVEQHAERLSELTGRLDSIENSFDEVAEQSNTSQVDLGPLRDDIQAQSARDDRLRQDLDALADRLETASDEMDRRLERIQTASDEVNDRLERLLSASGEMDSRLERLQTASDEVDGRLERLQGQRDDQLSESIARAEFRLALIEVAGFLRLGQAAAELGGRPDDAVAAYRRALSRLESLEDGRGDALRQLVARELEALRAVESTDWSALVGRLSALESESGQWPLAGTPEPRVDSTAQTSANLTEAEASDAGWWSGVKRSLGGLVRVTPREAAALTPAAAESVRERVRLHLAAAKAAASRRNSGEMDQHLEAVDALLNAHFDTTSRPVRGAMDTINEAAEAEAASLPDLGEALSAVERRLTES